MDFKLSEETINKVLNYLASKPYIEAAPLINDLQKATPIEEPKKNEHKS